MKPLLFRLLRIVVAVYVGILLLYGFMQRSFLYYPQICTTAEATAGAQKIGFVEWTGADGTSHGWRTGKENPDAHWVVFHGNAGFAQHRDYFIDLVEESFPQGNPEVLILEYPGYGAREGKPSESAFFEAARAAVSDLVADTSAPVYLIGESIGSGPACHVASELKADIAGLLLITPFDDLAHVASHHFPFLPVKLILRDRFRNAQALENYEGRVAIVVAQRDEVVPARFGHALHESYAGPSQIREVEGGTHNTLLFSATAPYWEGPFEFLSASETAP